MQSRMGVERCCCVLPLDYIITSSELPTADLPAYGCQRGLSGTAVWQKYASTNIEGVDVKPRHAVYICDGDTGANFKKVSLANGTEIWNKLVTGGMATTHIAASKTPLLAVSSDQFDTFNVLEVYNDTPTLQWSKAYTDIGDAGAGGSSATYQLSWDAAENLYATGRASKSGGGTASFVVSYDNGGTENWKVWDTASFNIRNHCLAADGNVYVVEIQTPPTGDKIRKFATSNGSEDTTNWPVTLANDEVILAMVCDSSSRLLIHTYDRTAANPGNPKVRRYTTTGTLDKTLNLTVRATTTEPWQACGLNGTTDMVFAATHQIVFVEDDLTTETIYSGTGLANDVQQSALQLVQGLYVPHRV